MYTYESNLLEIMAINSRIISKDMILWNELR